MPGHRPIKTQAARMGRSLIVAAIMGGGVVLSGGCTASTVGAPESALSPPTSMVTGPAAVATPAQAPAKSATLLPQIGPKVGLRPAGAAYQLTADELKYDCKRLTGRMQVRLLQIRDQRELTLTSSAAQAVQSTVVPVLGGSPVGANPADDYKRDRAWLEAYNAQLASKHCPVYNLENELQPRSIRDTPKPVPKSG
jgi:hypothetical protein